MEQAGSDAVKHHLPKTEKASLRASLICVLVSRRQKVIRRPAPSSEKAGISKDGNYTVYDTDKMDLQFLEPLPHDWSYYHARLKCGLVKGINIGNKLAVKRPWCG